MNKQDNSFQKGSNNGYLLSTYHPDFFEKVFHDMMPDNPYLNGVFAGKKQHLKEMSGRTKSPTKPISTKQKESPLQTKERDHE